MHGLPKQESNEEYLESAEYENNENMYSVGHINSLKVNSRSSMGLDNYWKRSRPVLGTNNKPMLSFH